MKRELTCICCPLGCTIEAELDGKAIVSVTGYTCPRGKAYAESECINPVRVVTSTVMSDKGIPVPVKTDRPIPKEKILECMKIINNTVVKTPVKLGDVVIENVFGSNIKVTAEHNG